MSDELVKVLRSTYRATTFSKFNTISAGQTVVHTVAPAVVYRNPDGPAAATEIERLTAEVRRIDRDSIHTCWDDCPRLVCMQRREIDALTAELARAKQEGWQPIETAPEWEEVIVYYGGRQVRKSQKTCIATAVNVGFGKWELGSMPPLHLAPTHWMPFPAPPAIRALAMPDPTRDTMADSDGDDGA